MKIHQKHDNVANECVTPIAIEMQKTEGNLWLGLCQFIYEKNVCVLKKPPKQSEWNFINFEIFLFFEPFNWIYRLICLQLFLTNINKCLNVFKPKYNNNIDIIVA